MENFHSHSCTQARNGVDDEDFASSEEEETSEEETAESEIGNTNKRRKASRSWEGFEEVMVEEGNPPQTVLKAKCNQCGAYSKLESWKFDQEQCTIKLCEMIIMEELPFKFVEGEGFKRFMETLCPQFKIPDKKTIIRYCIKLFFEHKISLKSFFQKKSMGRVSITSSCWTALDSRTFICVTAHYIDNWILHKKIISFRSVYDHDGDDIGAAIISSLEDWGLKNVLCCTVDNTSANDGAIRYMKPILESWDAGVFYEKYFHTRCVARIINLIVSDELEMIGVSVRRVREAVKWIKASPARLAAFKETVQAFTVDCTKSLRLDVPTRWDSTYLMLESALQYEKAIKFFGSMNSDFVNDLNENEYNDEPIGAPQEQDWVNIANMCEYLERFYDITLLVSDTKYASSHLFFKEMCDIFELINELELHQDVEINIMAARMRTKLEKYWIEEDEVNPNMNKILYIAALLDPRQKMKHVQKCLETVYSEKRASELVGEVRNSFDELFALYKRHHVPPPPPPAPVETSRSDSPTVKMGQQLRHGRVGLSSLLRYCTREVQFDEEDSSETILYFMEKRYMMTPSEEDNFDVLQWWLKNNRRFPILAEMAKDILAIPMSSVAFECAFSTGDRVLSKFRSSLTPTIIESLICAEDWLKSSLGGTSVKDEEDESESEMEKEFETMLVEEGIRGESDDEE